MKRFLLNVLSSTAGVCLAVSLMLCLSLGALILAGMSSSSSPAPHSVLCINLSGVLTERTANSPLASVGLSDYQPSLEDLLASIDVAAHNKNIDGIYIYAGILQASPASLGELRNAILRFRKSGKFVISYAGTYSQGAYYVCSAASRIYLNPAGSLEWRGLSSEMMFFKDLLDKVGVKMQVVKVGSYKSYVEPFTATSMSKANRVQVSRYIGSIWSTMCRQTSESRRISADSLNAIADRYPALRDNAEVLRAGLVDSLAYRDQVLADIASRTGNKDIRKIRFVSPATIATAAADNTAGGEIAVYYATGDIVSDKAGSLVSDNSIVASDVIDDLQDLGEDSGVKAVVLRINSGGGSAYASEQLWRAVSELKKKKPVVVSMGDMAASGAYYMSSAADMILADPTTLTGSIGIFGMIPDVSSLMKDKLGIRFDGVKTNAHSDMFSLSRPFDPDETAMMQGYVDRGYALFLKRVAEGRKMKPSQVDRIAQGRVWTGADALHIGLVDRTGTLDDAVAAAARKAGEKTYHAVHYPDMPQWWERFLSNGTADLANSRIRSYLGDFYPVFSLIKDIERQDRVQARMTYTPIIR